MEKLIEEENQQSRDASMMLQSINWKERREMLYRIQAEPALIGLFVLNVEKLLKDTNIVCLQLILQLLRDNLSKFSFQLPEIASILTNVVLQNTKTSIKSTVIQILQYLHAAIPHQVAYTLGNAAMSNNSRFAKYCLEIMQLLGGTSISQALALPIYHKNAEIKNFALLIAKEQLSNPECLQIMEKEFPGQIFYQILVEAVESVAGNDVASPVQKSQVAKSVVQKSYVAVESTKYEYSTRDLEMPNMDKMQWKDKKDLIEQLTEQVDQGYQISYDFGRQLKFMIDNEPNFVCLNALIRLAYSCAMSIKQWKYAKLIFASVLQRIREKRTVYYVYKTIPAFFYLHFKLQDVIEEFISCLQSKQTDQKQETAGMLRSLFMFEQGSSGDYDAETASLINANCVIANSQALARITQSLVVLLNDSVLQIRTTAQECLIQLIKLHMCTNAHILVLWDQVFGQVLSQPRCYIYTIQQLVYVIQQKNYLNRPSNEYKRLLQVVNGIYNVLYNYHATYNDAELYRLFGFSEAVVKHLNQIAGPPVQEALNFYLFYLDNVVTQTPAKRAVSQNRALQSPVKSPARRSTSSQQYVPKQQSALAEQILQSYPLRHYLDITLLFPQEIQLLQLEDESRDFYTCGELQTAISGFLQKLDQRELPEYLDAVVDLVSIVFSLKNTQIIMAGIYFITQLIYQYEENCHPTTLVKMFDVLALASTDPAAHPCIREYLTHLTLLYGYQPLLILLTQHSRNEAICSIAFGTFEELVRKTGFSDFYQVGLSPNVNVFYTEQTLPGCNLLLVCKELSDNDEYFLKIQEIVACMDEKSIARFADEMARYAARLMEIRTVELFPTCSIKRPLTKSKIVSSPPKSQSVIQAKSPQIDLQREEQGLNSSIKRPSKPVRYVQKPGLASAYHYTVSHAKPKAPVSQYEVQNHAEYDAQSVRKTTFLLKDAADERYLVQLSESFNGTAQFAAFSDAFLRGLRPESPHKALFEELCYLLIDFFDIDDYYLISCFPDGALNVSSSDAAFSSLVLGIVTKNPASPVVESVVSRLIVLSGFLFADEGNQRRVDLLLHLASDVFSRYNEQITTIPAMEAVLRLSLLAPTFSVNAEHICQILDKMSDVSLLVQAMVNALQLASECELKASQAFSGIFNLLLSQLIVGEAQIDPLLALQMAGCLGKMLQRQNTCQIAILAEKAVYLCYCMHISHAQLGAQLPLQAQIAKVYGLDQRFYDFLKNLSSPNIETYITAQKYIILLAREKKAEIASPIILAYSALICATLRVHAAESRPFDYRLLKYAALSLIELVETPESVGYFDYRRLQDTIELAAYFSLQYHADQEVSSSYLDNQKIKEVQDYFGQILVKLQQNADREMLFLVFLNILAKVYVAFHAPQSQRFPYSNLFFCNQLQTVYVVRYLLLNQVHCAESAKYAIAHLYDYFMGQLPFSKFPLPHISSVSQNDVFSELSQSTGVPEKDIKLLFRFCRSFAENCGFSYSETWDILLRAVQQRSASLQNSLAGSVLDPQRRHIEQQMPYQPSFQKLGANQELIRSPVSYQPLRMFKFSLLAFKQNPTLQFEELVKQALSLLYQGNSVELISYAIDKDIREPNVQRLLLSRFQAESSLLSVKAQVQRELASLFQ